MILSLLALAAAQAPSLPSSADPMPAPRPTPAAPSAAPPPARAETADEARYRACTVQVRADAESALAAATAWRDQGGGLLARQCLGLALAALERWAPAATAFEQAAREAEAAGDARRADFWVQSGNAWVADGQPARAVQAFDAALLTTHLTDELRGEVHLDRARALVALDNLVGARADLDRALQLVPADPFAWYLSAALARRENNAARAGTEIARARQLAPDNPDILLMAGTLAGQAGNMAEAERLYRQVATAAPDTDAGRAAAASLATMREIEVPAAPPAPAAAAPQGARPAPVPPTPAPPPQSR